MEFIFEMISARASGESKASLESPSIYHATCKIGVSEHCELVLHLELAMSCFLISQSGLLSAPLKRETEMDCNRVSD